jgi:hypothetical protein
MLLRGVWQRAYNGNFLIQKIIVAVYKRTHVGGELPVKGKAIPVTDHGGPYVCERSRLPHF